MILTYLIEFNSNDWPQKLLKKIPKFNFKNLEKLRIMSNEWNQFYSDFSNNSHTFYSNISRHFIKENGQQQKNTFRVKIQNKFFYVRLETSEEWSLLHRTVQRERWPPAAHRFGVAGFGHRRREKIFFFS